eukprot:2196057-Alexandrium_andersonii.AAC.1
MEQSVVCARALWQCVIRSFVRDGAEGLPQADAGCGRVEAQRAAASPGLFRLCWCAASSGPCSLPAPVGQEL